MSNRNKTEMLILAAHNLELRGRVPFTPYDLAHEAWKVYPDNFSMPGYNCPDSNAVICKLSGKNRGMVNGNQKAFEKVSMGRYRLTEYGHTSVMKLAEGNQAIFRQNGCMAMLDDGNGERTKEQIFIERLMGSAAVKAPRAEITFRMAQDFFDGKQDGVLLRLAKIGESDDADLAGEARALRALGEHMVERFSRHWKIIEERERAKAS